MPITIDGSGSIAGLSAGGLPDLSVATADIAASAVTAAKIADANVTAAKLDGAQSGTAPIYAARAWVNFNGTGTVAIRASGNVSSITDNGTGTYTVNFATATADANGSAIVTTWRNTTSTPDQSMQTQAYQSDVSTVDIRTYNTASTLTDHFYINVAVFR